MIKISTAFGRICDITCNAPSVIYFLSRMRKVHLNSRKALLLASSFPLYISLLGRVRSRTTINPPACVLCLRDIAQTNRSNPAPGGRDADQTERRERATTRAHLNPGLLCFHSEACVRVGRLSLGRASRRERDIRRENARDRKGRDGEARRRRGAARLICRRDDQFRER